MHLTRKQDSTRSRGVPTNRRYGVVRHSLVVNRLLLLNCLVFGRN